MKIVGYCLQKFILEKAVTHPDTRVGPALFNQRQHWVFCDYPLSLTQHIETSTSTAVRTIRVETKDMSTEETQTSEALIPTHSLCSDVSEDMSRANYSVLEAIASITKSSVAPCSMRILDFYPKLQPSTFSLLNSPFLDHTHRSVPADCFIPK